MNYVIKSVTNKQELKNAIAFGARIFGGEPDFSYANYSDEMIGISGDLLIFAEYDGEIVGIVFGHIEDNGNMTIGVVAVDERFRKQGVAREMMSLIEKRAKALGVHLIALGAAQTAEGFYAKLGYTGSLLGGAEIPTYAWRIMDLVNAMLDAGFVIRHMEEFHPQPGSFDCWWYKTLAEAEADGNMKFDWEHNPFVALPQWIGFHAQR